MNQQLATLVGAKSVETGHQQDDADSEKSSCSCWRLVLQLANATNHALVLATTGYLLYLARDLSDTTNLHMMLCTIGYVLLMSEAIVILAGENVWTSRFTRRSNSHLHWVLQVLGAGFSVAGVYVMYRKKTRHFRSVHALTGIASVGAILGIFASGLPALFAGSLRRRVRPVIGKFVHNCLGVLCFVVGMSSQMYGYQKGWLRRKISAEWVQVMIVTTAIITCLSLVGALRSLWQQFKGLLKWH